MRRSLSSRSATALAAVALAVLAAGLLTGCAWLGKGKDVADAFANTKAAKTGAYSLTLNVTAPRKGRERPVNETVAVQGAYDNTDEANPKMRATLTEGSETFSLVAPGNGRVYFTIDGETDSAKIPKTVKPTQKQQELSDKLSNALAAAFVNFRDAPPVVRSNGAQVQGIAADISRNKVCGPSVRSIVRTINGSKLLGGSKRDRIRGRDTRAFSHICSKSIVGNPLITFGLDAGFLTNIQVAAKARAEHRTFSVAFSLEYSGLNQPQTGFDIPPSSDKKIGRLPVAASTLRQATRRAADYDLRLQP
jgi:hypothetical protein